MKTILLTKGYEAIVDDDDHEYLSQFKWFVMTTDKKHFYAARSAGTKNVLMMHREILGLPPGRKPLVDHKDRNGLNNCRDNLRAVTHRQNMANCKIAQDRKKPKSSQYKGVCYTQIRGKWYWRASIGIGNKSNKFLGHFQKEEDAARAYNVAAQEMFGEFALLNEIKEL